MQSAMHSHDKADEHLLATLSVVGLIENNQTQDGAEPALLDEGDFLVSHKTEPLMNNVVMYLPVSNRQKIYGIAADSAAIAKVQRRLAFGVAVALGRHKLHIDGLKAEREELLKEKQQLGVIR